MKKLLALLLSFVMILSFAGCAVFVKEGKETQGKEEGNATQANTSEESGEVKYAKAPEASVPKKGKIEGNLYTSSLGNIVFEKPDNWEYATDEELASVQMGNGVYYDMACQDLETGSQIFVLYEELLLTKGVITSTADEYIKEISEGLYNSGLSIMSQDDKIIGENTYKSVTAYGEAEDFSVEQCSMAYKEGNTMVSIVVVALNDDSVEDILAYIK